MLADGLPPLSDQRPSVLNLGFRIKLLLPPGLLVLQKSDDFAAV